MYGRLPLCPTRLGVLEQRVTSPSLSATTTAPFNNTRERALSVTANCSRICTRCVTLSCFRRTAFVRFFVKGHLNVLRVYTY